MVAGGVLHLLCQFGLCLRAITRRSREPASRLAWVIIISSTSVVGMAAYILLGEVNIGRRRTERLKAVLTKLSLKSSYPTQNHVGATAKLPQRFQQLFRTASSINPFKPVTGNRATLLPNSSASIDALVADIDSANNMFTSFSISGFPTTTVLKLWKHSSEPQEGVSAAV